jgi:ribosomal protein S18 acetylase RimI-like enzyme
MHLEQIPTGQLSSMGPGFVTAFYRTLIDSDLGFAFVAERDGRPVGYATGIVHWRRFYRIFVGRNWLLAARAVIRRLLSLDRWRRLAETTRYAAAATLPDAELLSIALRSEARGTGTADALVREVLGEFTRRAVTQVRVTTASDNIPAARLYERTGFRLLDKMQIHPGESADVYVIALGERREMFA